MNLTKIVSQTLGIGNPFGKSEKRVVCEPIMLKGWDKPKLILDEISQNIDDVYVGPDLSKDSLPSVSYCPNTNYVRYFPKTITLGLDASKNSNGLTVKFFDNGDEDIVSISEDGQEIEVNFKAFYVLCQNNYMDVGFTPYFQIENEDNGCFKYYLNFIIADGVEGQDELDVDYNTMTCHGPFVGLNGLSFNLYITCEPTKC